MADLLSIAYNHNITEGYSFENFKKELDFLIKKYPKTLSSKEQILLTTEKEISLSDNFKKTITSFSENKKKVHFKVLEMYIRTKTSKNKRVKICLKQYHQFTDKRGSPFDYKPIKR